MANQGRHRFNLKNRGKPQVWTLGDGTSAGGKSVAHAFVATGIYTVTLTAKSDVGVSPATPDRMGGQTGHPNRVTLSAVKGIPLSRRFFATLRMTG